MKRAAWTAEMAVRQQIHVWRGLAARVGAAACASSLACGGEPLIVIGEPAGPDDGEGGGGDVADIRDAGVVGTDESGGGSGGGGETGTGGGGGTGTGTGGGETTTDGGETTTDGGGETTTDGGGETTTDGGGETTTDGGGETTTDGGGETTTDGGGETTTGSGSETSTDTGGETTTDTGGDATTEGGESGTDGGGGGSTGMQELPDLVVSSKRLAQTILIRWEYFDEQSCGYAEGCASGTGWRRLIRFSTEIQNVGDADLVLGDPTDDPDFEYAPCHDHYHLAAATRYGLYDGDYEAAPGRKESFCMEDSEHVDGQPWFASQFPAGDETCNNDQGLTRGWADIYPWYLDCQYIDITGVPAGSYVLKVTVNPEGILPESDIANNTGSAQVEVTAGTPPDG